VPSEDTRGGGSDHQQQTTRGSGGDQRGSERRVSVYGEAPGLRLGPRGGDDQSGGGVACPRPGAAEWRVLLILL
jgi:hypothetical protein